MKNKTVIIVLGEPYSVFLEILFKTFESSFFLNLKYQIILIGSKKLLYGQMKALGYNFSINVLKKENISKSKINNKKINLINVDFKHNQPFGEISNKSNKYIENSFKTALQLIKKKIGTSLINGPISKKYFLQGKSLGITEYLAKKTKNNNSIAMLIFNKKLSVSPITTHLAIKDIHKKISKQKIQTHVKLITDFYIKNFKKKPRIAVTGLNPHCESNFKNSEENAIIIPAIKSLKVKNFNIEGPFPADTIFMQEHIKKFDIIIGMYHDQVITPMKALFGFDAINITLGLPFIRISPDHGPNSSMLGKNLSDPKSLIEALKFLNK
ncbi:4-hydroxythreonine-4-phosphate dehydrogenase PdxA [Candidatus Pelagibacter sp.]|nr:4-hydroxythreonine-4-phosphate dehydrogenase PdxA [Candidatus Pelagibacter sp.]